MEVHITTTDLSSLSPLWWRRLEPSGRVSAGSFPHRGTMRQKIRLRTKKKPTQIKNLFCTCHQVTFSVSERPTSALITIPGVHPRPLRAMCELASPGSIALCHILWDFCGSLSEELKTFEKQLWHTLIDDWLVKIASLQSYLLQTSTGILGHKHLKHRCTFVADALACGRCMIALERDCSNNSD